MSESSLPDLGQLLATPVTNRDASWRSGFSRAVVMQPLRLAPTSAFHGPDGFPYVALNYETIIDNSSPFSAFVRHAAQSVCGLALLDREGDALHVFSHGDVVAFEHFGNFDVPLDEAVRCGPFGDSEPVIRLGDGRLIGSPSEAFLPSATRTGMCALIKTMGVPRAYVAAYYDPQHGIHVAINLSTSATLTGSDSAMRGALSQLAWFLPRTYPMCVLPEDIG